MPIFTELKKSNFSLHLWTFIFVHFHFSKVVFLYNTQTNLKPNATVKKLINITGLKSYKVIFI